MNIALLLEMAAEQYPDRVAVVAGADRLTYAELLAAARAAAGLFAAGGYRYVALLDANSIAVPVALFGAACAGIPYVPLNYRLTTGELDALLARVAPAYLIVDHGAPVVAGIHAVARAEFLAAVRVGTGALVAPAESAAIAVQLFTSGTTGRPKAAVLRHDHLAAYILGTVEFAAAAAADAILVTVPPYHVAGIAAVLSSVYAGRRMVLLEQFDADAWLRLGRAERISHAFVVPTMLARIVERLLAADAGGAPPSLRALAFGGGKMPPAVVERAMALFSGVDFTNAYGLTETSSTIALLGPEDHRVAFASAEPSVRRRLASVGRPLDTVELQVRDGDGRVLGVDAIGDIYVRGAQVAGEYLEAGSALDADGWFATRDRGWLDAGGYLFIDGRADDIIVRGGENISPGEIEAVLLTHPAVRDAAVVAVPSEQWGEAVAAVVVVQPRAEVSVPELQDHVRARLRSSRVPERILFSVALPYNEMGKLLRRVIRDQVGQHG